MVAIQQNRATTSIEIHRRFRNIHGWIVCIITGLFLCWTVVVVQLFQQGGESTQTQRQRTSRKDTTQKQQQQQQRSGLTCPSSSFSILQDLTEEQRNPTIGRRWMVQPPHGGNLHLVCCDTTQGSFHVLLHERWAPIGVPHLLQMFQGGYFQTEIPLFRCTDACQFGLSSNATLTKRFGKSIPDDPLWLPTGPEHRFSTGAQKLASDAIPRYPKGVLTHAGAGRNSRSNQFVLTLKPNKFMGGGSPWEVPLGEVVMPGGENEEEEDVSLPAIYTGYGEKGPGQALLKREGASASVRAQWPLLDYVLGCSIVDQYLPDATEGTS